MNEKGNVFLVVLLVISVIVIFLFACVSQIYKNERNCLVGDINSCRELDTDTLIVTKEKLRETVLAEIQSAKKKDSKSESTTQYAEVVCIKGYKWLKEGETMSQIGHADTWGDIIPVSCGGES